MPHVTMDEAAAVFELNPKVRQVTCAADLWALDKPARVLSHPNPPANTAKNAVCRVPYDDAREAYRAGESRGDCPAEVFLIHRLDQDTSGLLLLAFSDELAAELKELFYRREVAKQYRALVKGIVETDSGEWRDALEKRRVGGQLRVAACRGRPNAETRFRVVERFSRLGATLLELEPHTGRTHQLRVQSAARGHPIAGDERYGDFAWNRELRRAIDLRRMFLHAGRIELRHPRTGHKWKFAAELDVPLAEPLTRARQTGQ